MPLMSCRMVSLVVLHPGIPCLVVKVFQQPLRSIYLGVFRYQQSANDERRYKKPKNLIFNVLFGRGHLCHLKDVDAVFLSPLTKATIGNQLNQGMWWGLLSGKKNEHNYLSSKILIHLLYQSTPISSGQRMQKRQCLRMPFLVYSFPSLLSCFWDGF